MKRLLIGFYLCSTAALAADQCRTDAVQRPLVYDATGKVVGSFSVGPVGSSVAIPQMDGSVVYGTLKREGQGKNYPLGQDESVDSSALQWAYGSPDLSALYPEPLTVRCATSPDNSQTAEQRCEVK
jgi:hypothetical protein